MRKWRVLLLALLAAGGTSGVVSAAGEEGKERQAQQNDGARLDGTYLLSQDSAATKARQQAIDAAVGEFFFVVRPIVRAKLEKVTRVVDWVQVRREGELTVVHFAGRAPISAKLGGGPVKWTDPEGNKHDVKHSMRGETFIQSIGNDEGTRINSFSLTPKGLLRMDVEISSSRLSSPLRYHVTYKKRAREASATQR